MKSIAIRMLAVAVVVTGFAAFSQSEAQAGLFGGRCGGRSACCRPSCGPRMSHRCCRPVRCCQPTCCESSCDSGCGGCNGGGHSGCGGCGDCGGHSGYNGGCGGCGGSVEGTVIEGTVIEGGEGTPTPAPEAPKDAPEAPMLEDSAT